MQPTTARKRDNVETASHPPIVILGAGLAGLTATLYLRELPVVLVEREAVVGGKARSHRRDGFTFDVTGHWLHLTNPTVRKLVGELFEPGELVEVERRTGVYSHGTMLPYPFQANLHGLPHAVVRACLVDFIKARMRGARRNSIPPQTFEEFVTRWFGEGITNHFFVPYYSRVWGLSLNELTSSWVGRYIPVPSLVQVLLGAIGFKQLELGYNARFLYPASGGIDAIPQAILRACADHERFNLRLSVDVAEIDPRRRRIKLTDSKDWLEWEVLVSTIPLPALLDRIPGLPARVTVARRRLRSVPWRYLNIATRSPSSIGEHWVYVPEHRFPFFRLGVFTNAVPTMAPRGCGALWVELVDRSGPTDVTQIVRALVEMGAIRSPDEVLFVEQHDLEDAYVVFDEARDEAVDTIRTWLAESGILTCGRYGAWKYGSMEDAIIDGRTAATHVRRMCLAPEDPKPNGSLDAPVHVGGRRHG